MNFKFLKNKRIFYLLSTIPITATQKTNFIQNDQNDLKEKNILKYEDLFKNIERKNNNVSIFKRFLSRLIDFIIYFPLS
jgi:hypothetical protein